MATSFKKAKPVSKLSSKPTTTSNPEATSDSFYETRYNDSPTPSVEFKPTAGLPAKVSSTHTSPSKKAPPKFNIKPSTSDESDSFYNLNVDLNTMQSQGKLKSKPVVLSPQEQIELVRQRMLNQNQKQSQLPPPPQPHQPTIQNNDIDNHDLSFYQSAAFDAPSEATVRHEPLTQNPTSSNSNSNVNAPSNSAPPPSLTSAHLARQLSAQNINSSSGQSGQSGFQSGFQSGPSTQNNSSRTSPADSSNTNFTPSSSAKTDDSEFILALHQLVEVGFSVPFATIALKRCNMNVQEAIGFCLEHDDEVMQQFIDEEKAVQAARERNAQRTAQQNAMETASSASTESAVGKKPSKSLFKRMIGLKSKHDAVPTVTPVVTHSAAPHIPTVVRPQIPPPPAMNPSFQGDVVAEEDEQAVLLSLEREIPFAPTAEMQAEQEFPVHSVSPPSSLPVNRASPLLVPAPVVVSVVDSIPITPTPSAAEILQDQRQPEQRLSPVFAAQMEPSGTALPRPLSVGPIKPPKPASVRSMSSMALNQNTSGGHGNAISQMCIDEDSNSSKQQQQQQSSSLGASDDNAIPSFVAPKDKIPELMMSTSSDADEYGELLVLGQYNNRIATPLAREHTPLQEQEQQQQQCSVEEFRPTLPEESKESAAATVSVVEETQPEPVTMSAPVVIAEEQQQEETFYPSSSSSLLEPAEPTADSLLVSELGYDTPHNYSAITTATATTTATSSWFLNKPPPPLGPPPAIASAVSPAIIAGPLLMKVTSIYNEEEVRPREEVQQSNDTVIEQPPAVGDEVVFESPVAVETFRTSESAVQKEVVTVEVTAQLPSKEPVVQKFISSDDVEPVSVAALRPSLTDPVECENESESEKPVLADPTDSVKSNSPDDSGAADDADKQREVSETVVVDRATPSDDTEGLEGSRPLENSEALLSTDLSPQVSEDTAIIETSNWATPVTAGAVETTVPVHQIAINTEGNEGAEEDDGGDVFPEEPVLFAGNYRNSRSEYNLPFTAASTKPFQSSTTSEEVLKEGSEEIQVAAAVDEELEEQLEEDEAVLHPARANVSHYDIPTGNTASNLNSLVAAISSALLLDPSLSGAGSSQAVGSPPRSGAHIVNSVYVLPVSSASKSVSSESLLDNSNSLSKVNNNSSNQFTLSPRHITVSRSNSTSSAESEDNITSRAVAQNNNHNNNINNGNGNPFMINSNFNNNTSSNSISNIDVSRNSSQNNTTSASSGSVVGGAAPLENEGRTAVYDGEFEDPSGFEALLAAQSAADEFVELEPSAPLATSSAGNSNHNSFRNSFRHSYNGGYNNTREAFESVNTPPAPAPVVFSPLYHEIQRFVQTVHQREFLPIHVTDEAGGRFKAAISLKQTKLGRNESSPQGSHPNTVNIGLCSTRELARDLCYTLAPPVWSGKKESQKCQLCSVNFTMFKKGHHCRNCGHVVCNNCSNKTWPSSMVPTTYHDNEKYIRVCVGCQAGTEMFVRALRDGDLQSVLSLHEKANVNLHCPISLYVSSAHPVHCAAAGGNLDLLKWLIDVKKCSIRDNATKRMLLSGKNLTVLGVAAQAGHVDIMRYLVHNKKCSVLEITEMSILHRALHMALEAPGPMPPYIPPKGKKAEELLSEGSGKANNSAANNVVSNSSSNSINSNNVVNNSTGSNNVINNNNISNNSSINRNSVPPPPYAPPPPSSNRVNNNAAPSATSGNAAGSNSAGSNSAGSNNNRVVNNSNNSRNNSANSFDAGVTITPSYTPPSATSPAGSSSNYSYNNINNINNSNSSINNNSISNNASNMRQPLSLVPPSTTTSAPAAHNNTGLLSSTADRAGTSGSSQQSVQQATSSTQSAQTLSSRTPSYLSNMTATSTTGNTGTVPVATAGSSSAPAAPSVHTGSNNTLNTMNSTQSPNRPFRQQTSNSAMDTSFTATTAPTSAPTTTSVTAAATTFTPTTTGTNATTTSSNSRPTRQFSAGNTSSFDSAALSPASATSTGNNSVRSPNQGTSARRVAVPRALYNEAEVFIATAEVVHGDVYHSTAHSGGDDAPVAATAFLAEDVIFEVASLSRQSSGIDPLSSSPGSSLSREVSVRHIAVASPYTNVPRTELPAVPTHPVRGVNGQIPELIVESTASTAPPSRWFR